MEGADAYPDGLLCEECDGTGDRDAMLLIRAVNYGIQLGAEMTLAKARGVGFEMPLLGVDQIRSVVASSVQQRQARDARIRLRYAAEMLRGMSEEELRGLGLMYVMERKLIPLWQEDEIGDVDDGEIE